MHLHEPFEAFVILAIPFGLLQCFFGYHLLMATLALTGFLVFGAMSSVFANAFTLRPWLALCISIVGGVIGAVLMLLMHVVGVFLLGAVAGGMAFGLLHAIWPVLPIAWGLPISAVSGGVLALAIRRAGLILITSLLGSWLSVVGLLHVLLGIDATTLLNGWRVIPTHVRILALLAWGITAVSGMAFQFRGTGR